MLAPLLIGGFMLGATSSLHCVGMCGPLSLALPTQHLGMVGRVVSILFYQFGRVITYSLLGLVMGLFGRTIYLAGYQQLFSIVIGSVVVILSVMYFLQRSYRSFSWLNALYRPVQQLMIKVMHRAEGPFGFLVLGMVNGLLPCGMVYLAIAASLSFSQVWETTSFMAMYGIGTLPAMLMVAFAGRMMNMELRQAFKKIAPVFVLATGIVLILRGMNLGIPFISPALPAKIGDAVNCHV